MASNARSNCWSITINNPTVEDTGVELPAGWKLHGQFEKGENGTPHFQGALQTPQVRFAAVKKVFPRAHIEVAKSSVALMNYVKKEATRTSTFDTRVSNIPTMWDLQTQVATLWDDDRFNQICRPEPDPCWSKLVSDNWYYEQLRVPIGDRALQYVDELCDSLIRSGTRGVEFISINPMWRASWRAQYSAILFRSRNAQAYAQASNPPPSQGNSEESSSNAEV